MINKPLFIFAHQVADNSFYPTYKRLVKNQWLPYWELQLEQEKELRRMVSFAYENVPYYRKLFDNLQLDPNSIRELEDLERIPILTKEEIKKNPEEFKPINLNRMKFYERSTGGSTGTPFRYRLHKIDRFLGGALWYRGWSYAGYELGDRMIFMGGSSLGVNAKSHLVKLLNETARNIRMLSSFDMGDGDMKNYVHIINKFKPRYMYGYPSSLYLFAKWIDDNGINIHSPNGIFSTAEKLFPEMREKIESVFRTDLYDTYGLNDGGVSAYECPEHSGLHIDTERSVMEVVDKDGHQLDDGGGRILATSLYNYAMPFIRYDTGDIGQIISESCSCGRGYKLLKEVVGRSVDVLVTPEGKNVHGWFFLYIFWEFSKGIKEYQVVQEKLDKIVIKIVPEDDFDEGQLRVIRETVRKRSECWNVEFKFVDKIERTKAGKYKFIINEMKE